MWTFIPVKMKKIYQVLYEIVPLSGFLNLIRYCACLSTPTKNVKQVKATSKRVETTRKQSRNEKKGLVNEQKRVGKDQKRVKANG